MSTNSGTPTRGSQRGGPLRELFAGALCLVLLTVAAGMVLEQAGVAALVYEHRFDTSGDHDDHDALLRAIFREDVPAVRRLLRTPAADVNRCNRQGVTPIYFALSARGAARIALVELLIEAGADVNGPGGDTQPPIVHVAWLDQPELMARLLRAGADPNGCTRSDWTALHGAALCDDVKTITVLLEAGAEPYAEDDAGRTPLDVALANDARAAAALLMVQTRP